MSGNGRPARTPPRPGRPAHTRTAPVPPSPEVTEQTVADVVGKAVALNLAPLLAQFGQQLAWHPACSMCVSEHKRAAMAYDVAVRNAQAAAEPEPGAPELPDINAALTFQPVAGREDGGEVVPVPVCFAHFYVDPKTGPVRATGLAGADGRPLTLPAG